MDADDVDLLIGTDAPKVMEPWELINSQGEGPYIDSLIGVLIRFRKEPVAVMADIHGMFYQVMGA